MKSSFSKILLTLAALILCLAAMMSPALAAANGLTVQLDAEITLEGTLPDPAETYTIRLTADDSANPMPGGQTGGSYDLEITGAGAASFPEIAYDKLGIYTYTIAQVAGSNADCTYDARTYSLTVSVINAGQGGGLAVEVALREDGAVEKTDKAVFHNAYKVIVPTAAPTTEPGDITPTGVSDRWLYYMGGGALLLVAAGFFARSLLRRDEDGNGDE